MNPFTFMSRKCLYICTLIYAVCTFSSAVSTAQPTGFTDQIYLDDWNEVAGFTWDPLGRMFVWERDGRVWIVENGVKAANPIIDISDEVGGWRDFGLLGFALDPNFLSNGYMYMLYVVDRHHLMFAGTPQYDPNTNDYFSATIGRITRYQADPGTTYSTLLANSRFVLLGDGVQDGPPILHESHGTGSLVFGDDGTLLATLGDGASYSSTDQGSATETYWSDALNDGIITNAENIGAYRCQTLDNFSGKIVRLDPQTGHGLPSNPFYDSANPKSPASRMWARGVRNPYRMTKVPGSGSHVASDGNPGVFIFGDVGWGNREELNIVNQGGMNFGWPRFEGMTNQPYPNAAYDPSPHDRPKVDWRNGTPRGLVNGNIVNVGSVTLPGPTFNGNASTGGVWFHGHEFPEEWHDTYFHADYGAGWIRNFKFDADWNPIEVKNFINTAGACVFVNTDPENEALYYVRWPDQIRKVSYTGTTNHAPVAFASANIVSGTSPLTVSFSSINTYDEDGDPLILTWDFGDGTTSNEPNPVHTFSTNNNNPIGFEVTLTASEAAGLSDNASLNISLNNQTPVILSTSVDDIDTFNPNTTTALQLNANVSDGNHSSGELSYFWDVRLYHNNHNHPLQSFNTATASTNLTAVSCYTASYWYRVLLIVTDPTGASATFQKDIFPACAGNNQTINFSAVSDKLVSSGPFDLIASASSGLPVTFYVIDGPASVVGNTVTLSGVPGKVTIAATQPGDGTYGSASNVEQSFWVNVSESGSCPGTGLISREVWTSISGVTVPEIPINSPPDIVDQLTIFEIPVNTADNFGTRVRGYICPPQTGNYQFWISSDDNGELWLSTDSNPANKQLIANVPEWSNSRQWNKFSTQQSGMIALTQGQLYYVEALQKEQGGGDNLAVGWQLPDNTLQRPIPGSHLLPYGSGSPIASLTASPNTGEVPLTVEFNGSASNDSDGTIANYSWDFGDGNSTTGIAPDHTYNSTGVFNAQLTVTDNSGRTDTDVVTITVTAVGPMNQTIGFPAIADQVSTNPPITLNATASSGLPVTYQLISGPAVISGNTLTLTGQMGTVTVRANQSGNGQWNAADPVERSFNVTAGGGDIDLSLTVTSNPSTLVVYNNMSFTFTLTNSGAATATNVEVLVPKPAAVVWIGGNEFELSQGSYNYFGDQIWDVGSLSANESATITVNWYVLSTDPLTAWAAVENAAQTDVNSTPGNTNCCASTEDDETVLTVTVPGQGPQNQSITFAAIPNKESDEPSFSLTASATSSLPVSFELVSGPATINNNIVTLTGTTGTVTILATQAGNASWNPATPVERSFLVSEPGLENQTIDFGPLANKETTSGPFDINATASSSLPVSFSILSGPATVSGNTIMLDAVPGQVTVRASQAGNSQYNPAPTVDRSFQVTNPGGGSGVDLELSLSASPTTVTQWGSIAFTATLTNNGTATANGVEIYFPKPSSVVFVGGNEVTVSKGSYGTQTDQMWMVGSMPAGTTETITVNWFILENSPINGWAEVSAATPSDDDSSPGNGACCTSGEDDEAAFTATLPGAGPQDQIISFPAIPNKESDEGPFDITVSANSGLPVSLTILSGPATIAGNTITLTGTTGQVTVEANQAGNSDWNPAPPLTRMFNVNVPGLDDQTINFPAITNKETTDGPFTIVATASSGLPVSLEITDGPATISGNTITLNGAAGSVTVRATQTGNAQYNPALSVSRTFVVTEPGQGGGPDIEVSMTSSSPNLLIWQNVTFTITVTNNGGEAANNIRLDVPIPQGLAHTSNEPSKGSYDLFFTDWTIGTLAAGETATLDMVLFCLQNTTPLPYFVQVINATPADIDSSPDNNSTGMPVEDDEALLTLAPATNPLVAVEGAMFTLNVWKEGATTQLKWLSTIGEYAEDYIVERSSDGFYWQQILQQSNTVFENERAIFNDEDRYPLAGWNFYRIKQSRLDGSFLYSNVAMLEHWDDLHDFKLFPNPANDYVDINLFGVEGQQVRLLLVDRMGRLHKEMEVETASSAPHRMYLGEVPEGWYVMWIQANGSKAKALPLIIGKR